jgi:maltooligosyltrehalose trehalohydrolase
LTALFLLLPETPMLFQGQEFAASTPFFYFGDQKPELADLMLRGRQDFLSQFPSMAGEAMKSRIPRPDDPEVFARSKLDPSERERHAEAYALHCDLLRLRRDDPALRVRRRGRLEGAVLGPGAFVLRYLADGADDRLLLVNLGPELALSPASEPLLAPPAEALWDLLWSSEDPRYGGGGIVAMSAEEDWILTGHSALVMSPVRKDEDSQ